MLAACGSARGLAPEVALPDGDAIVVADPSTQLEEAAGDPSPSIRALALRYKVATAPPEQLTRWAMQGGYDPDVYVQRAVIDALVRRLSEPAVRGQLTDYIGRASADPYARGFAARSLLAAGDADAASGLLGAWRDQSPFRSAPLALAAALLGEDDARSALHMVLATGELRDDDEFFVALGLSGEADLEAPAEAGRAVAEEELATRLDFALALMGNSTGEAGWRAALKDPDPRVGQDALELVLALPADLRASWGARARVAKDKGVKQAAAVIARPTLELLMRATRSEDPFVRVVAARLTADLEPDLATSVLAALLRDEDLEVRRLALDSTGRLALSSLKPYVAELLRDPREDVRIAAAGVWTVLKASP